MMVSQLVALLIALDPQASTVNADTMRGPWLKHWPATDSTFEVPSFSDRRMFVVLHADTTITVWKVRKLIP